MAGSVKSISELAREMLAIQREKESKTSLAKWYDLIPFVLNDVSEKYYRDKTIKLDGYRFKYCRFDRCTLSYDNTNFSFENCIFSQCTILHPDGAIKSIKLFNLANFDLLKKWPDFSPTLNHDGTMSIL